MHICGVSQVNAITIDQISLSTVLVIYHDTVVITSQDAQQGNTGTCDIAVNCNEWSTSGNSITCLNSDLPPARFNCWTSADSDSPVCVEPGSMWVGALVGCIICGVFAIGFLLCALAIMKSIRSNPSGVYANSNNYNVGVVYPSAPQMTPNVSVAVVGTASVLQPQPEGPIVTGAVVSAPPRN
jgi:hypothetical protein